MAAGHVELLRQAGGAHQVNDKAVFHKTLLKVDLVEEASLEPPAPLWAKKNPRVFDRPRDGTQLS